MRKEEKKEIIDSLATTIAEYDHLYVADIGGLNAEKTSLLRRKCFESDVKLIVVKNTLLRKALESAKGDYSELYPAMKGESSVMLSNTGNLPARLIKEFRKGSAKPSLKGAYVQECVYIGDHNLDALCVVKSKNELIGDVVAMLQSPAKNVISALQSGGNIIHGVLKTLGEKENK